MENPQIGFVRVCGTDSPFRGTLEPATDGEAEEPFAPGEDDWRWAGADMPAEVAYWRDRAAEVHAKAQADGACTRSPRGADEACKAVGDKRG